jgi:hypothetical protein
MPSILYCPPLLNLNNDFCAYRSWSLCRRRSYRRVRGATDERIGLKTSNDRVLRRYYYQDLQILREGGILAVSDHQRGGRYEQVWQGVKFPL